ncbi:MAG: Ig-like domain-containing protein, partial [Candidatus Parcubacteria bacterium]|nr:Ig-like domain-containing protein [Candidatus Parcubacteria bacterium]
QFAAKGIIVTDALDPNLSFVPESEIIINNGESIPNTIDNTKKNENDPLIFTAGGLDVSQSGSITFDVIVKDTALDHPVSNIAQITGNNFNTANTNIVSNLVTTGQIIKEERKTEDVKTVELEAPVEPKVPAVSAGASVNLPPQAVADSVQVITDQEMEIAVLVNDSDPENQFDLLSLTVIIQPQNGTTTVNSEKGIVVYRSNPDFSGEDNFSYKICDSVGQCAEANVSVSVELAEAAQEKSSFFGSLIRVMTEDVSKTNLGEQALASIAQNETVKAIIDSKPVKFVQDKVLNNPVVEQVSQDVVTPTLVTVSVINTAPAIASAGMNLWAYLHFIFVEPLLILFRKKRKNWGVVYDSLTKMPISLALVRLYRKEDRRLIQTRVTDRDGRYLIMVKDPGNYYLEVTKPNYDFPTKILSTEKMDTKYLDLYHGEEVTIKDKEAAVSVNIPLDVREKKVRPISAVIRSFALQNLKSVISYVGLILAVLVLIIYPSLITTLALVFHVVFYVTFRKLLVPAKPKGWGIVYDEQTKIALHNVVVRLFDIKFNKLLETQLTDSKGRYAFLVGKNVFQILAEKDGYQAKEIKPIDLATTDEIVKLDIA